LKLLLNLQEKRGLAILFITHDIALARKVSDRMAVMLSGKIVEEGPTGEVTTSPLHPYTMRLLEVAPDLAPARVARGARVAGPAGGGAWAISEPLPLRAREL
ncbi:MAG: ABC transporter ATP-binding protein, partial [Methanothrix sp.]